MLKRSLIGIVHRSSGRAIFPGHETACVMFIWKFSVFAIHDVLVVVSACNM
jgi:hypothetical protein